MEFRKTSPCQNCPYRKDAPLCQWHPSEFVKLLSSERSELGEVFGCHKNDNSVCVGWLMDQDKSGLPSIRLRLALSKNNVNREYLDSLHCRAPRFKSVNEMIAANYPNLVLAVDKSIKN